MLKNGFCRYKSNAEFYPKIVVTDKCHIYDFLRGYRKLKHIRAHFETKLVPYGRGVIAVSQNRIERYHSEIRPKEVRMRGVIHNFLRKHQTLGCTPAEFSGVNDGISWNNIGIILETCAIMD